VWQAVNVRDLRWLTAVVIPVALTVAGCGSSLQRSAGPSRRAIVAAFHGSPAPLAALHVQADQLLGGGASGFRTRMRSLRGHPVIVNLWASWCVPCQTEFPIYQKVAVRYGREIGFLGLDVHDSKGDASAWLKRYPVTYPSYVDPDRRIEAWLRTIEGTPQTFFFNAQGREEYDHGGPYTTVRSLERDIRTYLGVR
jgi:cytochrome c biogenesis protein CcmG/thiol:disulfide interchange protein DsbE